MCWQGNISIDVLSIFALRYPTMRLPSAALAALASACIVAPASAQVKERPLPRLVKKDGRFALLVDDAPLSDAGRAGAQLQRLAGACCRRCGPPWSTCTSTRSRRRSTGSSSSRSPGQYDFTLVDTLLTEARQHKVHLVLLWFGTWKNGSQHYMPEWMKLEPERYPHMVDKNGERGGLALAVRGGIAGGGQDGVHRVHAASQGSRPAAHRDHGAGGERARHVGQRARLLPGGAEALRSAGAAGGAQGHAGERRHGVTRTGRRPSARTPRVYFHAWSVAKYVGQVAAAGKAVYPLPMYANAALRDPLKTRRPAGSYESGGPTDNVLSIWKVAAPGAGHPRARQLRDTIPRRI